MPDRPIQAGSAKRGGALPACSETRWSLDLVLLAEYLLPLFTQHLLDLFHFFRCISLHLEESCTTGRIVGIRHVKRRQKWASAGADLSRSITTRVCGMKANSIAGAVACAGPVA